RRDAVSLRRRPRHLAGERAHPGASRRRGAKALAREGRPADRRQHRWPLPRHLRRVRRERARAQPRARRGGTDHMTENQPRSLLAPEIVRPALIECVAKLDPRVQVRNPVMFVVEIGAVITTVAWLIQVLGGTPLGGGNEPSWFTFTVSLWLWLTVVF